MSMDFDRAELPAEAAQMTCAACKREIIGAYYAVNASYVCPACHAAIVEDAKSSGSFPGAVLLGTGAAVLGALLYWLISLSGYEFGIIAIIVGVVVGKAVRKGAGMRRGAVYRIVAIVLTYLAMTATYVPKMLKVEGVDSVAEALLLAVMLPGFMMTDVSNALGLIILGIGLYEAWQLSAPPVFTVEGPFDRKATAPELAPVAADSTLL